MASNKDDFTSAVREGRNVRVADLSRAVGVTPGAVYMAIQRGEIRAVRIGKAVRVPADEARRLLGLTPEMAG